jgi:AhpD family alkylhydroperoxidase
MQSRMNNPVMIIPGAMQALQAFSKLGKEGAVPASTIDLIHLRVSQINGCSVCVDMHWRQAKAAGETDERIFAVAAWRDAPYFTDAERAALGLAEAVTRLSDRSDPVPDEVWDEAARHYSKQELGTLLLAITAINTWNRLNVATRQLAGEWRKSEEVRKFVQEHAVAVL